MYPFHLAICGVSYLLLEFDLSYLLPNSFLFIPHVNLDFMASHLCKQKSFVLTLVKLKKKKSYLPLITYYKVKTLLIFN